MDGSVCDSAKSQTLYTSKVSDGGRQKVRVRIERVDQPGEGANHRREKLCFHTQPLSTSFMFLFEYLIPVLQAWAGCASCLQDDVCDSSALCGFEKG